MENHEDHPLAFDPTTATRIRKLLAAQTDVVEKPMVGGGLGFLVNGRLCFGVSARGLTVRVGPDARAGALAAPHVRPLRLGGRDATAFVVVEQGGYASDEALRGWLERGLEFVATLPAGRATP
jgi:hypothetical protein